MTARTWRRVTVVRRRNSRDSLGRQLSPADQWSASDCFPRHICKRCLPLHAEDIRGRQADSYHLSSGCPACSFLPRARLCPCHRFESEARDDGPCQPCTTSHWPASNQMATIDEY